MEEILHTDSQSFSGNKNETYQLSAFSSENAGYQKTLLFGQSCLGFTELLAGCLYALHLLLLHFLPVIYLCHYTSWCAKKYFDKEQSSPPQD